jgi:hypothetical protein
VSISLGTQDRRLASHAPNYSIKGNSHRCDPLSQALAGMPKSSQIFLVVALCAPITGCFWETADASYASAMEAINSGVMGKGWIPEWLPQEATDLREVLNIDSNASELSFLVSGAKPMQLPADCKPIGYPDTVPAYLRRDWWPSEDELKLSYVFFRCPADFTDYRFVAINKAGNRVLHWRTYAR